METSAKRRPHAFTLIELLVVVAVIGLLISVIMPSLGRARQQATSALCLSNNRVIGQGLVMYTSEYRDVFVPGRLPKIDSCNSYADIMGGRKYRPTFLAMTSQAVNAPPFEDPKACKNEIDKFGEAGDRQNYSYGVYVCPAVPEWTDERNGSIGYNYHFMGNSRLSDQNDIYSYKNWPVRTSQIRYPSETVAAGDCMGTAASLPKNERQDYENNARNDFGFGNEGFNLDPPRIDETNGEAAGYEEGSILRTAADPRHLGLANMLWVDGHASSETVEDLGYTYDENGAFSLEGNNTLWSGTREDIGWTPDYDYSW